MARSGAITTRARATPPPVALRHYLARRSALELVVLDLLVLAGALWVTLPAALSFDVFWLRVLLGVSPGLLLVARSIVVALHVPGVLALAQLDPGVPIGTDPHLTEARHLTWVGVVLLGATVLGTVLLLALLGVGVGISVVASS